MDRRQLRIWCATAVLTLAVGGAAYAKRPATEPTLAPRPQAVLEHRPAAPAPPPRRGPAFTL